MNECRARERGTGDRCTRERAHAHWKYVSRDRNDPDEYRECSECTHWINALLRDDEHYHSNYSERYDDPDTCPSCFANMKHTYAPVEVEDTSHLPAVEHLIKIRTCDPQPTWFPSCSCGGIDPVLNHSSDQHNATKMAEEHLRRVGGIITVVRVVGGPAEYRVHSVGRIEYPMGYEPERPPLPPKIEDDIPF